MITIAKKKYLDESQYVAIWGHMVVQPPNFRGDLKISDQNNLGGGGGGAPRKK